MATITLKPTMELTEDHISETSGSTIVTGWKMQITQFQIWWHIFLLLAQERISFKNILPILKKMYAFRKTGRGDVPVRKYIKKNGQIFFSTFFPPFPSSQFDDSIRKEFQVILNGASAPKPIHFSFLSITKRCPLKCEHCFEWDIMHAPEKLSIDQLKSIVDDLQVNNLSGLYLTGGEPLRRYEELVELVSYASPKQKVWVLSSGYGFSLKKAQELKKAGLTGIFFSLDHFEESEHDTFRGKKGVFQAVMDAVGFANSVGLVVAITLTLNKKLLTEEFLVNYLHLAKSINVDFVQFLEPRASGNYKNKDIALTQEQIAITEQFYSSYNGTTLHQDAPLLMYQNYQQRRLGCNGGYRFLYIDSNGDIQACPFCTLKMGSALNGLKSMKKSKCDPYSLIADIA